MGLMHGDRGRKLRSETEREAVLTRKGLEDFLVSSVVPMSF